MERFKTELEKLFDLYNKKGFFQKAYEVLKNISAIRTVSVEEKNFSFTEEVIGIMSLQRLKGENADDIDFTGVYNLLDKFLETKLERYIQLLVNNELTLDETTEFGAFIDAARRLLEANEERRDDIIKGAKELENIAYPLTEKYFVLRYLAKAIVYIDRQRHRGNMSDEECVYSPKSYENEKKLCLNFSSRISAFERYSETIQNASERFDSENKCAAWLLRKSNKVDNHSGKIAAAYVTYIAMITAARNYIDKYSGWYQGLALPSTILAIGQVFASFPKIIFSKVKTGEINKHIFEHFYDVNKIDDIQFLNQNIPSFSNDKVSKVAIWFRWMGNLMLQPIDLFQNDIKDQVLRWTAMRWFTPTGVIEEQDKVAYFVNCALKNFFYDNIIPYLIDNRQIVDDKHIKRFFYLLYKQFGKNETEKQERLKEIYMKLTGEKNVDFEKIVSDKEKRKISTYQVWLTATYAVGFLASIAEYVCFAYRNQDVSWYEDPAFYFATLVKFMRLGSLVSSKCYADNITEYFTGNKMADNIYFQDFFCNDAARMTAAVIPLIMFESTNDVQILSIATAIDVLTTTRSDMNAGKAISIFGKLCNEKLIMQLLRTQGIEDQEASTSQQQSANDYDQPGPSNKLSEVQSICSKSLSYLYSDSSHIEVVIHSYHSPTLSSCL